MAWHAGLEARRRSVPCTLKSARAQARNSAPTREAGAPPWGGLNQGFGPGPAAHYKKRTGAGTQKRAHARGRRPPMGRYYIV